MLFYWLKRLWVSILLKQRCQFPLSANFTCRFSALSNCVDIIFDGAFLARIFWFFFSLGSCSFAHKLPFVRLICTLTSDNQCLIKISGPAHLIFFSTPEFLFSLSPGFFQVYGIHLKKIQVYWKKNQFCRTWNFSRPWFSEIKVQNKWLKDGPIDIRCK